MKIKIYTLICAFLSITFSVTAQYVTPTAIPTQGGIIQGGGIIITYTTGQSTPTIGVFSGGNIILTPGFQQPIIPVKPVAPLSQNACSDTSVVFTFSGVQSGKGGNKIEWATNAAFTGSHILSSPANIIDTVSSGNVDTIWIRSVDVYDNTRSEAVYTIAAVYGLPEAAVAPSDTIIKLGDSLTLSASGGSSYYWPQFGTDSSSVAVILTLQIANYRVLVSNANGCTVEVSTHIEDHSADSLSSNYIITQWNLFNAENGDTVQDVPNSTVIYGCEDSLQIGILINNGPESSYEVQLPLPAGLIPFSGSATPAGITPAWNYGEGLLTWTIPDSTPTLILTVDVYFDCAANQQHLINHSSDSSITASSPTVHFGSVTSSAHLPSIIRPEIKISSDTTRYALIGQGTKDTFSICLDTGKVYSLLITSTNYSDSLKLTGSTGQSEIVLYNSTAGGYVINDSLFMVLCGEPYLKGCINAVTIDSIIVPDTCGSKTVGFNISIRCNTWAGPTLDSSCGGQQYNNIIEVNDDDNLYPVRMTTQLYEGGTVVDTGYQNGTNVTSAGFDMCHDSIMIQYTLFNPSGTANRPSGYNQKILQRLTLAVDPAWIDTSNFKVFYKPGDIQLAATDTNGFITVTFSNSPQVVINDSSTGLVQFTGLTLNYPSDSEPCSLQGTGQILSAATLQYTTLCHDSTYTVDSASVYTNPISNFFPSGNPDIPGDSTNSGDISPNNNLTVNFCWGEYQPNSNPWGYTAGNGTLPFFNCDSVTYSIHLNIPALVSLIPVSGSYQLTEVADGGVTTYHILTKLQSGDSAGNGIFIANLSPFSNDVCLSATLRVIDSCPASFTGGEIAVTCNLVANCVDTMSTCDSSRPYCLGEYANTMSVHCPGICNGTGIGTSGMVMTNLQTVTDSTPNGLQSAYACDVIDFLVTGAGYFGDSTVPPDSTKEIYLLLTYPGADGGNPIFDSTSAVASYSYPGHINIPISASAITGPSYSAGAWTIKVPIVDRAACESIRYFGTSFVVDLKLKVKCDLAFTGNGYYDLNFVNAQMEYIESIAGHTDTAYSCDGVAENLQVFDHQYGTEVTFLQPDTNFPCLQTLLIKDSATGGFPYGAEMPGLQRPLITWPTDGSLEISYPNNLSIQKIIYSNSGGFTFNGSVQSDTCTGYTGYGDPLNLNYGSIQTQTVGGAANDTTHVYGFANSCNLYSWPIIGKDGVVFYDQLEVVFNKQGCDTFPVTVILPHQQQDGKDSIECISGCDAWITDTFSNIETRMVNVHGLSYTLPDSFEHYSNFLETLTIHPDSGVGLNTVWIHAFLADAGGVSANINLVDSGTNLINTWFRPASDTLQFNVQVSPGAHCMAQNIELGLFYTCPVAGDTNTITPPTDTCGMITASINIPIEDPGINLRLYQVAAAITGSPTPYIFANSKGICCRDVKTWAVDMDYNYDPGFALSPTLTLIKTGSAILNISEVIFKHYTGGGGTLTGLSGDSVVIPINGPVNVLTFNFNDPLFDSLNLPRTHSLTDSSVTYISNTNNIEAIIKIFGNENNCGWQADLQAVATVFDYCGNPYSTNTDYLYFFDLNNQSTCPPGDFCQDDTLSTCNLCDIIPIVVTPTVSEPDCHFNNGSISIEVSGGPPVYDTTLYIFYPPSYTYIWNTGSDSTKAVNLSADSTYTVTVISGECADTLVYHLNNSGITNNYHVNNISCYGGSNGKIVVTASVDSGTLSYRWNNGSTSDSITGLSLGTYYVTITNSDSSSGCSHSVIDTIQLHYLDSLVVTTGSTNATCFGDSTGSAYVNVQGGSGEYDYTWDFNGQTSSVISLVPAGIYTVTITDTINGCNAVAHDTISQTTALIISPTDTNVTPCYGGSNASIKTVVTGGTPAYIYAWNNYGNGDYIRNLPAGTYTLTVTDAIGCSVTASYTVTQPAQISIVDSTTNEICHGDSSGSIVLHPTGGTGSYTYMWNGSTDTSNMRDMLSSGTDTVTVTDGAGCQATKTFTVIQPRPVQVSIQPVNITCSGSNDGGVNAIAEGGIFYSAPPYYTFHWNIGATTPQIGGLGAGIYNVTVTDSLGCSATASDTLREPPVLGFDSLTNVQPTCGNGSNGCITVYSAGGTGTITYAWDNGDHGVHNCGLFAGSYTITITDANGCSLNITDTLKQPIGLTLSDSVVNVSCEGGNSGSITTTVTNQIGNVHYVWDNGDTTANISSLAEGIYTLTVTDSSCFAIKSFTVITDTAFSFRCCFDTTPDTIYAYTGDTVLSDTLHIPPGSFVYFGANTVLIVNSNLTLQQCEIVMGSNAKIDVDSGETLTLQSCNLHGCTVMWDGIFVASGGTVIMGNRNHTHSRLADAMNGIEDEKTGAILKIDSTTFDRNRYGIQLLNYAPTNTEYDIHSDTFTNSSIMLPYPPPPPGQYWPIPDGYPLAGIYISNSSGIDIPNAHYSTVANTFDSLNCGIYIYNSSVNIYSNYFNQIKDYSAGTSGFQYYGSAVYAMGIPASSKSVLVETNTTFPAVPMVTNPCGGNSNFTNCKYGINAWVVSLTAQYNCMDNCNSAITTNDCRGAVSINGNYIANSDHQTFKGITLNSNTAQPQQVLGNQIAVQEPVGTASTLTYGISQTNAGIATGSAIWGNYIYGGRYGIMLNNIYLPVTNGSGYSYISDILYNHIFNANHTQVRGPEAGIYLAHCSNPAIDFNYIDGNGTTYDNDTLSANNKSGIQFYMSTGGELCSNIIGQDTGIGYGINFTGLCNAVDVRDNSLYKSKYGLVLQKSVSSFVITEFGYTSIGSFGTTIYDPNNTFYGDNNAGSFAGSKRSYTIATGAYNRPIYYCLDTSNLQSPFPTGATNSFDDIASDPASALYSYLCLAITVPPPHHNGFANIEYEAIANGFADTLLDTGYTATGPWLLQRMLYQGLCDSVTAIWGGNMVSPGIATSLAAYIDTTTDSLMLDFATTVYDELIYGKAGTVPVDSSALLDTALANFFTAAQTSDYNAIQEYTNQLQVLDTITTDTTAYDDAWATAVSLNTAISGSNTQAANFKTIQSIYLQTIARNDTFVMDSGTLTTVYNIAVQCPYIAGDAVYYARSLYAQYVDSIYFDDLVLCPPVSSGGSDRMLMISGNPPQDSTEKTPTEFVKVYPNPAKNLINLAYTAQTNGIVYFELTDELGQSVMLQRLGDAQNFAQYETGNLSSGLYYWRLKDSMRTIKTGKVVIIQ